MSDNERDIEAPVETTSVFRADFIKEMESTGGSATVSADSGVERLSAGTALLVVKRGPNAGSRFLLDQATTSAGRHPDSDIFLDDVTVSRRHAEFRLGDNDFQVVDVWQGPHELLFIEAKNELFAEALDVHGRTAAEVLDPPGELERALGVRAVVRGVGALAHER